MSLPRLRPTKTWAWIIAAAVFAIALPAGALAATGSSIVIVDSKKPAQKARVTAQGRLTTTTCGGKSCAAVDGGSLRVGDGSGPLTVDGEVRVAAPATPWTLSCSASSAAVTVSCGLTPPAGHGMVVSTISIRATAIQGSQFPYVQCNLNPGSSTGFLYVDLHPTGTYSGQDYYIATVSVNGYIDDSESMTCTALRTPTTGSAQLVVTAIGYQT